MKQKGEEQHILQLQSWKSNKIVESNREMSNIAIAMLSLPFRQIKAFLNPHSF